MKIILSVGGVEIEIDLDAKTFTAAIPVEGQQGEIRVEDTTPPIVRLTLPFEVPDEQV